MTAEQKLEALIAGAREATQGEWKADPGVCSLDEPFIYHDLPEKDAGPDAISVLFNTDWATKEDCDHVAAHSPANMLPVWEAVKWMLHHSKETLARVKNKEMHANLSTSIVDLEAAISNMGGTEG